VTFFRYIPHHPTISAGVFPTPHFPFIHLENRRKSVV